MLDSAGQDQAEEDLLEEFAAALFGEIGARAAAVAEREADLSDRQGVADRWRRIAAKVRARA